MSTRLAPYDAAAEAAVVEELFNDAVHDAAQALDTIRPGWAEKVDPGRLDMGSFEDCVLGQVFGCYLKAMELHPRLGHAYYKTEVFPWTGRHNVPRWAREVERRVPVRGSVGKKCPSLLRRLKEAFWG